MVEHEIFPKVKLVFTQFDPPTANILIIKEKFKQKAKKVKAGGRWLYSSPISPITVSGISERKKAEALRILRLRETERERRDWLSGIFEPKEEEIQPIGETQADFKLAERKLEHPIIDTLGLWLFGLPGYEGSIRFEGYENTIEVILYEDSAKTLTMLIKAGYNLGLKLLKFQYLGIKQTED